MVEILADLRMDKDALTAALLFPLIEARLLDATALDAHFDAPVCNMLHAVDHTVYVDPDEKVNLVAYGGESIKTDGTVTLHCTQGQFKFHVVNRDVKPILGLQDSMAIGLIRLGPDVHMLQPEAPEILEFKDLFDTNIIGKLPVIYHMRIDDTVAPTICAARRIPIAMKDKVKAELDPWV